MTVAPWPTLELIRVQQPDERHLERLVTDVLPQVRRRRSPLSPGRGGLFHVVLPSDSGDAE